ncbi:Protein trigalactosyldiacylglycerol 3, chloroplastic [Vitis vinifera]|uniref:Protein trigalactosyldiacylglycerol 3, chloroplastic n=1 Tax=Vitis vinifera TaxID=29760 RepID=A0A438JEL7_VITVI|nr:Protein trigalactosyldiacylglycerol 3, chloroplastic [Vitis vinifera]
MKRPILITNKKVPACILDIAACLPTHIDQYEETKVKRLESASNMLLPCVKKYNLIKVLLYDEPTAGLDPIASTVVEDLIRSVHLKEEDAPGKLGKIASYVVVTHQHSTIRRAVDRLLFLYDGKIVWEGMTDEFTTSTNPIVQQFASGSLDGPIRY